jgi:hypothetical protein
LPHEAKYPSKKEDESNPVQLMMNYFSALVYFKNKSVVDLVLSEDLDIDSSCHNYEYNYESEDISFYPRGKLLPIVLLITVLREC